ncbi:hypothetical protein [Streptomyces sp. bgisy091]|uniref:hypothetical protein n=1 Tax=Streptomyces sp. bgisy091 TaxID=3413778 RepID=UPI003D7091DB
MGLVMLVLLIWLLWFLLALFPLRGRTARLGFTSAHLAATTVLVIAADRSSPGQLALWLLLFGSGGVASLGRLIGAITGMDRDPDAEDGPPH